MAIKYRPGPGGARTLLDVTTGTQISTGQGTVYNVFVNTAPTATGGVYDAASSADATAANLICIIPEAVGILPLGGTQFINGLYVDPGTGGALSIGYD